MRGFSDKPCRTCGWRHQLDAFRPGNVSKDRPGDRVRVLSDANGVSDRMNARSHRGETGFVVEWSAYCGPVYVRVEFPDGVRGNFDPCQLEHA